MRAALLLAERGLGRVWPNPAVGCVIVNAAGQVVGCGWTQPGGRPHAETEALKALDDVAYVRFASVYRNFREAKDFHELLGQLKADETAG